jgi:hypothetical protein
MLHLWIATHHSLIVSTFADFMNLCSSLSSYEGFSLYTKVASIYALFNDMKLLIKKIKIGKNIGAQRKRVPAPSLNPRLVM